MEQAEEGEVTSLKPRFCVSLQPLFVGPKGRCGLPSSRAPWGTGKHDGVDRGLNMSESQVAGGLRSQKEDSFAGLLVPDAAVPRHEGPWRVPTFL